MEVSRSAFTPPTILRRQEVPLDWRDKDRQIRGTQAYRPFKCSLRGTVVTDMVLSMSAATIDVTPVQVDLRFRLVTKAIYLSSIGVQLLDDRVQILGQILGCVWNCFRNRKMAE
ncbi:uncharacterized protein TNCV_2881031 [Trichonephila clavipes]|nr:uncharacterized protein TNCV_2881031 [Trichonephila clavipes]